mmetsp:Transcript_7886/g.27013  ORF Transcript_7886/g.27013 Transcript_7886/m.27013 type:complete len:159 (+) Transcript_7886:473-949(+)
MPPKPPPPPLPKTSPLHGVAIAAPLHLGASRRRKDFRRLTVRCVPRGSGRLGAITGATSRRRRPRFPRGDAAAPDRGRSVARDQAASAPRESSRPRPTSSDIAHGALTGATRSPQAKKHSYELARHHHPPPAPLDDPDGPSPGAWQPPPLPPPELAAA